MGKHASTHLLEYGQFSLHCLSYLRAVPQLLWHEMYQSSDHWHLLEYLPNTESRSLAISGFQVLTIQFAQQF